MSSVSLSTENTQVPHQNGAPSNCSQNNEPNQSLLNRVGLQLPSIPSQQNTQTPARRIIPLQSLHDLTPEERAPFNADHARLLELIDQQKCHKTAQFWIKTVMIVAGVAASILAMVFWQAAIPFAALAVGCWGYSLYSQMQLEEVVKEGKQIQENRNERWAQLSQNPILEAEVTRFQGYPIEVQGQMLDHFPLLEKVDRDALQVFAALQSKDELSEEEQNRLQYFTGSEECKGRMRLVALDLKLNPRTLLRASFDVWGQTVTRIKEVQATFSQIAVSLET